MNMRARSIEASLLAAMLTASCAWGQQGAGTSGATGVLVPPEASTQPSPRTATNQPTGTGAVQAKSMPSSPKDDKPTHSNSGLTFLPELKPTDGVTDLSQLHAGEKHPEQAPDADATLLDRAAAVIDGEVILESDVRDQQHFAVFQPYAATGDSLTPLEAMREIVNRTLLLHQMTEQQLVTPPTDAQVDEQIASLRRHIPACAGQQCETEEGWRRFLTKEGYTEQELHERWKQRMEILNFIEVRFRTGIRIAQPEIEKYYNEKLVPEFAERKLPAPPLATVSARIDEVLLQQHVNVLLDDYLRSLKDAGSVRILDQAYNSLGQPSAGEAGAQPGATDPGDDQ